MGGDWYDTMIATCIFTLCFLKGIDLFDLLFSLVAQWTLLPSWTSMSENTDSHSLWMDSGFMIHKR
jgi:hypothetical protein